MFEKLRTNRFMEATGRDDASVVEFIGKVQRMAQVHQLGLKDRTSQNSRVVLYEARPLLGLNIDDRYFLEKIIIKHLRL